MSHKNPAARRKYQATYRAKHRERLRRYWRQWRADHLDAVRGRQRAALRQKLYNVTEEQVQHMLRQQGSACAICGTKTSGRKSHWCVDHDHAMGAVRGLLCRNCNVGLGNFQDNPATLRRAADYLTNRTEK